MSEFAQKQERLRNMMEEHRLDAILLQRVSSFAWATCGAAAYVNIASTESVASLLVTLENQYLFTNNNEATRLEKEEKLAEQGWKFFVTPWHEKNTTLAELTRGLKLGADGRLPGATDLSSEISRLWADLTPEEDERFRTLGCLCAEAMKSAVRAVRPGQSEYEIAALLAGEAEKRGVNAIVNLVATDQRMFDFRHPLPTTKKLECYAMLVLCGRRQGLVCSVTRFVYFGRLPDEIRRKAEAVAKIDATMIASTRPGRSLGEIFQRAVQAYADCGYPDEWHLHHQGGPAGYEPREHVAMPGSTDVVALGQVYAWNPSITGAKSEDTILVGEMDNEILTAMKDWPTITVEVDGRTIKRPAILEII
jgi:antitoxin VapB